MKKLIIISYAIFCSTLGFSQSPTFNQGDLVFNAGIGLGSTLYSGRYYSSRLPAISLSAEYGVKEDFITEDMTLGIGGYFGIAGSEYSVDLPSLGNYGYRYTYTIIGARAAVHYPIVDKLDTYGGVMLGYNIVSVNEFGNYTGIEGAASSSVAFSLYVGGRYYFTERFAAMGELGYGIAWLNLGVALKI